jgi:hypothetical protein
VGGWGLLHRHACESLWTGVCFLRVLCCRCALVCPGGSSVLVAAPARCKSSTTRRCWPETTTFCTAGRTAATRPPSSISLCSCARCGDGRPWPFTPPSATHCFVPCTFPVHTALPDGVLARHRGACARWLQYQACPPWWGPHALSLWRTPPCAQVCNHPFVIPGVEENTIADLGLPVSVNQAMIDTRIHTLLVESSGKLMVRAACLVRACVSSHHDGASPPPGQLPAPALVCRPCVGGAW